MSAAEDLRRIERQLATAEKRVRELRSKCEDARARARLQSVTEAIDSVAYLSATIDVLGNGGSRGALPVYLSAVTGRGRDARATVVALASGGDETAGSAFTLPADELILEENAVAPIPPTVSLEKARGIAAAFQERRAMRRERSREARERLRGHEGEVVEWLGDDDRGARLRLEAVKRTRADVVSLDPFGGKPAGGKWSVLLSSLRLAEDA